VLRFTTESAFAGAALGVEAKDDGSCTTSKALAEIDVARSNRSAEVGLFVMSKSHAPESFPLLSRHGNDILVVWDAEDELTDPYLHAAVILGLGLASRQRCPDDAGDLKALAAVEHPAGARAPREDAQDGREKSARTRRTWATSCGKATTRCSCCSVTRRARSRRSMWS